MDICENGWHPIWDIKCCLNCRAVDHPKELNGVHWNFRWLEEGPPKQRSLIQTAVIECDQATERKHSDLESLVQEALSLTRLLGMNIITGHLKI